MVYCDLSFWGHLVPYSIAASPSRRSGAGDLHSNCLNRHCAATTRRFLVVYSTTWNHRVCHCCILLVPAPCYGTIIFWWHGQSRANPFATGIVAPPNVVIEPWIENGYFWTLNMKIGLLLNFKHKKLTASAKQAIDRQDHLLLWNTRLLVSCQSRPGD